MLNWNECVYLQNSQVSCNPIQCPNTPCPNPYRRRGECCPTCSGTCSQAHLNSLILALSFLCDSNGSGTAYLHSNLCALLCPLQYVMWTVGRTKAHSAPLMAARPVHVRCFSVIYTHNVLHVSGWNYPIVCIKLCCVLYFAHQGGNQACVNVQQCPQTCQDGVKPPFGSCCRDCSRCIFKGEVVLNGISFQPPRDPCRRCVCNVRLWDDNVHFCFVLVWIHGLQRYN